MTSINPALNEEPLKKYEGSSGVKNEERRVDLAEFDQDNEEFMSPLVEAAHVGANNNPKKY